MYARLVNFLTDSIRHARFMHRTLSSTLSLHFSDRSHTIPETELDGFGHPRIPFRGHYEMEKNDLRRRWAESFAGGKSLQFVSDWWNVDGRDVSSSMTQLRGNLENPIGLAKIPIGLVGPVLIHGKHVDGYIICPFATTEGSLVASATRGATACNRAGGITTHSFSQHIIRAPCFVTGTLSQATELANCIISYIPELKERVSGVSRHSRLTRVEPFIVGRSVHVQFVCETGEGAGQNMVTSVTSQACKWILREVGQTRKDIVILNYWVEANGASDKKFSHMLNSPSIVRGGRGVHSQADVYIPESLLKSVLKVDSSSLLSCFNAFHQSSWLIGAPTTVVNVSNAIAAIFSATGQDIASTVESSAAYFNMEPATPEEIQQFCRVKPKEPEGGIYISTSLPSVIVGTVGGGTGLATQQECLQLMGCTGENGNFRLAEIIAAITLSLDLSTLSAIASGQFAAAHERLGKNHPNLGIHLHHLNRDFFSCLLGEGEELVGWTPLEVDSRQSILSDLAKVREFTKIVGHLGYELEYKSPNSTNMETKRVVIKVKATGAEVCNMLNKIAQGCGGELADIYDDFKLQTGFWHTDQREMSAMSLEDSQFLDIAPEVYHVWSDNHKDIFVIAMEKLEDVSHFDTVHDISQWSINDIKVALSGIARFHSLYLGRTNDLVNEQPWFKGMDQKHMVKLQPLWRALVKQNASEFPEMWTPERSHLASSIIDQVPQIFQQLDFAPQTLIHNDFNPRNICLRPIANSRQLCAYDWELATVHVPQRDVAELLSYLLPPDSDTHIRHELVEYHRQQLEKFSGQELDKERYHHNHMLVCLDMAINRLALYTMAHTFKDYRFLPRVITSHFNYLQQLAESGHLKILK